MLKKVAAAMVLCTSCVGFAGFIDHGDSTGKPIVYGNTLERIIAWKHFPEVSEIMPVGLSRRNAWIHDIREAAEGLGVSTKEWMDLVNYVLDPVTSPAVKAPHAKLYEFELYANGRVELSGPEYSDFPPSWKKLLSLPIDKRRYTTIPVLRAFDRYRQFHGDYGCENLAAREQALFKMLESKKQGCFDTQGCIMHLIDDISRNPGDYKDRATAYRLLFRKQFVNDDILLEKSEYKNIKLSKDLLKSISAHWLVSIDMIWALYNEKEEVLREICQKDPVMRDYIVCVGLTNREVPKVRKVAWEFYKQSVINYPAAAVKLPTEEAVKLLDDYPEHHNLRDLLIIKKLKGEEKIRAIDNYVSKYPDFASTNNVFTYIGLNTHSELNAMAGAELFKMGKPYDAAVRWLKGCAAEDMGMVAEQVMSVDELKQFCDKYFPKGVEREQSVVSISCEREYADYNPEILNSDQLNFMLRNLLARRLMRDGKFAEARAYFTGDKTRSYSEKFFELQTIIDSDASKKEKMYATLNMAALVRFHGDKLFGTFLEPDNLISKNKYPCKWGTKQKYVKLNKTQLPRYSYRYRAAELYAKAADMTDDRNIKVCALWTAGTLLKNRAPKIADIYLKKLLAAAPELTENNWFKPLSKVSVSVREFYARTHFAEDGAANHN